MTYHEMRKEIESIAQLISSSIMYEDYADAYMRMMKIMRSNGIKNIREFPDEVKHMILERFCLDRFHSIAGFDIVDDVGLSSTDEAIAVLKSRRIRHYEPIGNFKEYYSRNLSYEEMKREIEEMVKLLSSGKMHEDFMEAYHRINELHNRHEVPDELTEIFRRSRMGNYFYQVMGFGIFEDLGTDDPDELLSIVKERMKIPRKWI